MADDVRGYGPQSGGPADAVPSDRPAVSDVTLWVQSGIWRAAVDLGLLTAFTQAAPGVLDVTLRVDDQHPVGSWRITITDDATDGGEPR